MKGRVLDFETAVSGSQIWSPSLAAAYVGNAVQSRMRSALAHLAVILLLFSTAGLAWSQVVMKEVPNWTPLVPKQTSPDPKTGKFLTVRLQFVDPNNKKQVTSDDVQVSVTKWDGKPQTKFQAQALKAVAIRDAINAKNLNGVEAILVPGLVPASVGVRITGLAIVPKKNLRQPNPWWQITDDPTNEGNLIPGGGGNVPTPKGGSMDGTRSGMSSGVDPSGNRSIFAFGVYAQDGSSYVATVLGQPGLTDSEILGELASQFNSQYPQSGLTATYDSAADSLRFEQSLTSGQSFFSDNTDTGIDFGMSLYDQIADP